MSAARVAIVGAGIGGAFTAVRLANDQVAVDTFEAEAGEGGRVQEFEVGGEAYELGASIFWDYNQYVKEAAQRLGLVLTAPAAGASSGRQQLGGWWRAWWQRYGGPAGGAAAAPSSGGGVEGDGGAGSRKEGGGTSGFAVWDGRAFVLNMTGSWASQLHAAARYGTAALRYRWLVAAAQRRFQRLYALQAGGVAFEAPDQLLRELGLFNLTQQRCSEYLADWLVRPDTWWLWGGAAFADEVAGAINRCNYNQRNDQLNALAGLVSYGPAAYGSVWRIQGGNRQLVSGLLSESGAAVTASARVTRVRRTEAGQYLLRVAATRRDGASLDFLGGDELVRGSDGDALSLPSSPVEACKEYGPYDAVVIAAPLLGSGIQFDLGGTAADDDAASAAAAAWLRGSTSSSLEDLGASETDAPADSACGEDTAAASSTAASAASPPATPGDLLRPYQVTVTSFVTAPGLRPEFFGVSRMPPVTAVLVSSSADAPFSAISVVSAAAGNGSQENVYKVFSREALSTELLAALFEGEARLLASRLWYAYPRFQPPERFAPFQLAPGLVYGNALEAAASAMEVAAAAGTNSALLVLRHLAGRGAATGQPARAGAAAKGGRAGEQQPQPGAAAAAA